MKSLYCFTGADGKRLGLAFVLCEECADVQKVPERATLSRLAHSAGWCSRCEAGRGCGEFTPAPNARPCLRSSKIVGNLTAFTGPLLAAGAVSKLRHRAR